MSTKCNIRHHYRGSRRYLIINVLLIKMLNTAYCSGVMLNILQSQTEKSKTPVEEVAIIKLIRNINFFNFMMPYHCCPLKVVDDYYKV